MAISDWDHRQLCPDGACVGVIGPDGTCKTCGRVAPDWGDERRRGLVATDDGGKDGEEAKDGGEVDEIAPSAPALIGEAAVWNRRQLCPDGACVGLLGPDGTCKVCGKSAADAAGEEEVEDEEGGEEEAEEGEEEAEGSEEEAEGGEDEEEASDEEAEDEEEDKDGEDEAKGEDDDEDAGDPDLGDRKLCPDGACIGVIGPDNRCKVCGKEVA